MSRFLRFLGHKKETENKAFPYSLQGPGPAILSNSSTVTRHGVQGPPCPLVSKDPEARDSGRTEVRLAGALLSPGPQGIACAPAARGLCTLRSHLTGAGWTPAGDRVSPGTCPQQPPGLEHRGLGVSVHPQRWPGHPTNRAGICQCVVLLNSKNVDICLLGRFWNMTSLP